ncbi:hypothetical protein BGX26_005729 [Mortierella sp. AD094]|nr:hypothetical protein BGX26_005729 [Mortierella sp. AD094]
MGTPGTPQVLKRNVTAEDSESFISEVEDSDGPGAMRDDKLLCILCNKSMTTSAALRTHKVDSHDGPHLRISPLKCLWCLSHFLSRSGLSKHLNRCKGLDELSYPWKCPHCGHGCATVGEICSHSRTCKTWEQDSSGDSQALLSPRRTTARYSQEMFEPAEMRLSDGSKAFALLLTSGSKRLQGGSMAYVRSLKRQRQSETNDIELEVALKAHHYGSLVNPEDYKGADGDPVWHMPFRGNGKTLCRMLAGLMIQSKNAVLFGIKTEVYGRLPSEDAHRQDLALPAHASFSIVNSYHGNTNKVMIGTLGWNALITCCVILTSGKVVVGPDNPEFHPHEHSHIWIRKELGQDFHINLERQTRSKFNAESTFESYAAVERTFNLYTTIPVTLKSLWEYKIHGDWTGIKTAAFLFHKLYTERRLVKIDVDNCLLKSSSRKAPTCQILEIVCQIAEVMADVENVPVSDKVNKYLTMLAGKVQGRSLI